MGRIDS
ncbi:hypothetical protein CP8484711_2313A, partial [Chlamydia psittaci 84-8471/1]